MTVATHHRWRSLARAIVALAALVTAASCASFDDPSKIKDLRIIATRADPSEIILRLDLSQPDAPMLDESSNLPVSLTPLVVDPTGDVQQGTYTVTACPNDPFGAGPPAGAGMNAALMAGGARTSVGSELCDDAKGPKWLMTPDPVPIGTATTIQPTADQLVAAFMADVFVDQYNNVHGGFDLGMPLTLQIDVDTGAAQAKAVKRILYWAQQIDAQQAPNMIPISAGLTTYPDRDPVSADPVGDVSTIDPAAPFPVAAGSKPWIEPAAAQAESYETTVLSDVTHAVMPYRVDHEIIRYAFYATAGTFAPFRTASEPPPGFMLKGDHVHLESQYSAPPTIDGLPVDPATGAGLVTIWVVLRDDRGGESWLERRLAIQP